MENFIWNPGTLLETSGYYWRTCTLHAAVRLDIFTVIGTGGKTARQVSDELKADLRGLTMLLNALSALQLLKKDGDIYLNTEPAEMFLSKSSDRYIGFMIMHHYHLLESWYHMPEAILSGKPTRERSSFSDEERRESFLMGMFNIGMATAPKVAKEINLTGCTRLLDMGGGPGTFAIHFCMANPDLEAVVFDLETTRPFAEKTIARFSLEDRVKFFPGDFTTDTPQEGEPFDAAWLSHVLHGEGPDQARKVIAHAIKALKPGSRIFIHEFILDDTFDGPLFPALFSLNMFLGTPQGQSYSQQQLSDMLTAFGCTDITRHSFVGPTQSGILSAKTADRCSFQKSGD